MKFVCPNCKAKYQIADEKIQGRTLKMDCRRCNTAITIRGDLPQQVDDMDEARPASVRPPASASASRRPAGAAAGGSSVGAAPARSRAGQQSPAHASLGHTSSSGSMHGGALHGALGADFRRGSLVPENRPAEARPSVLDQWHVAINDVPVGPMRREEISRKIATGAVHAESLAWREGFDDWRPVRDIPELAALLRRAEPARPEPSPGARGVPAPRAGLATAGSRLAAASPSRLGGGAASRPQPGAAAARGTPSPASGGNVVPIGGRLGGAAPALDEPLEDEEQEEATQIASAADLGLLAMEAEIAAKPAPEKARIPAPVPRKDPTGPAKNTRPAAKPEPEPVKAPAPIAAKPAPKPAPAAPEPVAKGPTTEDGLPPLIEGRPSTPFAAPPAAAPAPAPAPLPIAASAPVAEPERRRRGMAPGVLIGIAGAVAFGAVFAFVAAQRMFPATPAATAPAVAAITPPPAPVPAPPEVEIDPPVATETTSPETTEATPAAPAAGTGAHHTGGGGGARPSTGGASSGGSTGGAGASGATKALTGDFARLAEGGGPAPLSGGATERRLGDDGATATSELTSEQISRVVTRERTGLQRCWETAIRGMRETPTVRIDVDLTIGSSGSVTSAAARGPAVGTLSDCIERGVRRWRFPPSSGTSRTSFPVVFSGTN